MYFTSDQGLNFNNFSFWFTYILINQTFVEHTENAWVSNGADKSDISMLYLQFGMYSFTFQAALFHKNVYT